MSDKIKANADKLPKKKMKLEGKMNLTNYLEEREVKDIERQLNEDATTFIANVLGYGATGLAGAFGGTLLVLGGVKAVRGLAGLWRKIAKNVKSIFNPANVIINSCLRYSSWDTSSP